MGDHVSEDTVLSWVKELSNWGRWGDADALGTLNFITTEVRRRAAEAVRAGETVSCAYLIHATPRQDAMPTRYMIATGEGLREPDPTRHVHAATDSIAMQVHGHVTTHLDALSHWMWDARLYNNRPANVITAERGATQLGVEDARDGIVTRGVLLDVAAVRDVDALAAGESVHPDDLEAAQERQGVRVQSGDAVLLFTGHSAHVQTSKTPAPPTSWAGWDASCLPWLHRHEVALIGAEASNEVMPNDYNAFGKHPIHSVGITAMGLWLIDNCDLSRLAVKCRERNAWDFLFAVAPLVIRGATGSPLNPVAVL
jgi:kynurenine formamidase